MFVARMVCVFGHDWKSAFRPKHLFETSLIVLGGFVGGLRLLEHRLALELCTRQLLQRIFPLFVGDTDPGTGKKKINVVACGYCLQILHVDIRRKHSVH